MQVPYVKNKLKTIGAGTDRYTNIQSAHLTATYNLLYQSTSKKTVMKLITNFFIVL